MAPVAGRPGIARTSSPRPPRERSRICSALEERHIRRVLKMAGGNKSRAARMLGISRRTLYRKKTGGTIKSLYLLVPILALNQLSYNRA